MNPVEYRGEYWLININNLGLGLFLHAYIYRYIKLIGCFARKFGIRLAKELQQNMASTLTFLKVNNFLLSDIIKQKINWYSINLFFC